jgi:glycosyltransferase involved in cell wall biosynthesis
VITPAYNASSVIAEAIRSVQAQTVPDWEFIVVDDGSTDDTAKVVEALAGTDSRIRLIKFRQNQGVSKARNVAMEQATGEFLAFLDADDDAKPRRLEAQDTAFRSDPGLGALGTAVEIFGSASGSFAPAPRPVEVAVRTMFGSEFITSSVTMRRRVQREVGIWFAEGSDTAEDWEFFSRVMRFARMGNLTETLARYRRSPSQATAALVDSATDRAAMLRREQILWLGVPPEEIDIEAHIAVSPSFWPVTKAIAPDAFARDRIAHWMNRLIAANESTKRYDSSDFQQIVAAILTAYRPPEVGPAPAPPRY